MAIKDLYRLCHESGERQMLQTEHLIEEAFQSYNKKFQSLIALKGPLSSTSVSYHSEGQNTGSNQRVVEPINSSLSVTDIEESSPKNADKSLTR